MANSYDRNVSEQFITNESVVQQDGVKYYTCN
jgi:hypothetical protein